MFGPGNAKTAYNSPLFRLDRLVNTSNTKRRIADHENEIKDSYKFSCSIAESETAKQKLHPLNLKESIMQPPAALQRGLYQDITFYEEDLLTNFTKNKKRNIVGASFDFSNFHYKQPAMSI